MRQTVTIALGSNEASPAGQPLPTLVAALAALPEQGLLLRRISRFFATPCFPAGAGPDFVNACATLHSDAAPERVLDRLHAVEARFGRQRLSRWSARPLDLDLVAIGDAVRPDRAGFEQWRALPPEAQQETAPDRLILPHPRLQDRAFVLVPLMDIAPDWCHPVLGQTVRDMVEALPKSERQAVVPL